MGLNSRRSRRAAGTLLAALVVAAAFDALQWRRLEGWNTLVAAGDTGSAADAPAPLRFAAAHVLATGGADEAALKHYGTLLDDTPLGRSARYNAANLLLRQALVLRDGATPGQALPLVELAKEHYRDVLRRDPEHWNARYNLERAQRLVPDPDDADPAPPGTQRDAERAVTTMRGHSPGLP